MFCCLRTCLHGGVRKSASHTQRRNEPKICLDPSATGPDVILLSNHVRVTGAGGALATAPLIQSKSYFEVKVQQSGCWSVGVATHQTDLTKSVGGYDKESWCLCSDNATRHNGEEFRPVVATTEEPSQAATSNSNNLLNGNAVPGLIGIEDVPDDDLLTVGNNSGKQVCNEDSVENIVSKMTPVEHSFPDEGDIVGVAFDHVELNFYFNGKNLEVPFRNVKGAVYPVVYVGNGAILDIILDNFNFSPPPGFDKIMLEQSLL